MGNKILLLLGGAHHDFTGFEKFAVPLFETAGYEVTPTYEREDLKKLDGSVAAVAAYTSYGGATDKQGNHGEDLNAAQTDALISYVASGGGLLGVHCATVMAEANTGLHKLYGGRFVEHPPMFRFTVTPMRLPHPITDGVDAFTVYDEFYIQDVFDDCTVLMTANDRGVCHPMVWTRTQGKGRVACVTPGHDGHAWAVPEVQKLTLQSLAWVTG